LNGSITRPLLADVTLVAVSSVALSATIEALRASMAQADFGRVLLLSDQPPSEAAPGIEWVAINRLRSRAEYSHFILRDLARHVSTGHALCVQWDGYVVNGAAWQEDFLTYDYIGAVWPQFTDGHRVGNGGFSLRSRRLLEACKDLPFDGEQAEDIVIARTNRAHLEQAGMCFAPEEVADEFAYERRAPTGREFGFHGAFNLVRYLSPRTALRVFRSLDQSMLTRGERLEIFRWALARGRLRLAKAMLVKPT
jgi:hypothetical protein